MIESGGEWISSVDLESVIMDKSVARQTPVFSIPHPKLEKRPVVAVVLKDGYNGEVTEEAIISPPRSWFAKWWLTDHVLFMNELPITGTLKVMKRVLRDIWIEGKLKT